MEYHFLESFLSNMDNSISYAIFGKDGNCIVCEGKLANEQRLLNQINNSMKKTITSNIPIFSLTCKDNKIFSCVRTGTTGFVGKCKEGNILVAQKSSTASVVFLGDSNCKGSFLYNITRALRQHDILNNEDIDLMNGSINSQNKGRLKG